jgi:hypothetical protein
MSFFQKIIFITFLFLSLLCFSISSAFAQTFYYYQAKNGNVCDMNPNPICEYDKGVQANPNYQYSGCSVTGTTIVYNRKQKSYTYTQKDDGTMIAHVIWIDNGTNDAGNKVSVECPSGSQLVLNGCEATCETDPCKQKAGQTQTRISQCGLLQGTNCTSKATPDAGDTFTKTCDSYDFSWTPINSKYNLGGCEAAVTAQEPLIKNNGNLEPSSIYDGSSNTIPLNCEVTLTYSGEKYEETNGTQPPKSSPKSSTTGGSASSPTNDGSSGTPNTSGTSGLKPSVNGTQNGVGTGGGSSTGGGNNNGEDGEDGEGGNDNGNGTENGTCDPSKSICEGSGDGGASTGDITKPQKIQNTVTKSWWDSSYKDGSSGVWDKHKNTLDNTPFIQSLNSMANGAPNSGTCPSFSFQFLQYNGTLQPPCMIWPALKAFFLFSTLMLCRRIIFGG